MDAKCGWNKEHARECLRPVDDASDLEVDDAWTGRYACGQPCPRKYDCGIHPCPEVSHNQPRLLTSRTATITRFNPSFAQLHPLSSLTAHAVATSSRQSQKSLVLRAWILFPLAHRPAPSRVFVVTLVPRNATMESARRVERRSSGLVAAERVLCSCRVLKSRRGRRVARRSLVNGSARR